MIHQTLNNLKNSSYKFYNLESNCWITKTILRYYMSLKHYKYEKVIIYDRKIPLPVNEQRTFVNFVFEGINHCVSTDKELIKYGATWEFRTV